MGIRVLYDSYSFDREVVGGVTRYFAELIKHLPDDVSPIIAVKETSNLYLRSAPFNFPDSRLSFEKFLPSIRFRGKYRVYRMLSHLMTCLFPGQETVNEKVLWQNIQNDCFDIVHLTGCWDNWSSFAKSKPMVVTMHDLIPELFFKSKASWKWRRRVLSAATRVIAVSEHTRDDVIKYFDCPPEKIVTIYHGVAEPVEPQEVLDMKGRRYVLFIGKRNGYKNFPLLVKAISCLMKNDQSLYLVCTGSDFTADERRLLSETKVMCRTYCRRFSDKEMRWLLQHALLFVYPSCYEGFGMPILDAFAVGCPVLLSSASCFPEIGGDAAMYFDPESLEDLVEKLNHLLGEDEEAKKCRQKLIAAGRNRVRQFSWQKCAQETVGVYKAAIEEFNSKCR